MKRNLSLLLLLILTTVFFSGCTINKIENNKIPYLPISQDNVLYIGLYGYSQEGQHSNNRKAADGEITQIINWLNNLEKYDSTVKIPKGNGKPVPSNIQVFTKDNKDEDNRPFMSILEKDNGYIMISGLKSDTGYIVYQPELNKILKKLRQ